MTNLKNPEILHIVTSIAREKAIPKAQLFKVMEEAIQVAGNKKYGAELNIQATIDQNTGCINLFRVLEIVENAEHVEDHFTQIDLESAKLSDPNAEISGQILDPLPPIDLGRVAAQTAKRVIIQKVSEIDKIRQYEDYKDRKGEILNGIVKRIEAGNIIVDIGRAEALLHSREQMKSESFKVGDRIKAYVKDVKLDTADFQILLSRTDNEFLRKLFTLEVPEIYDNTIEIKAIARDPGFKAKIAVYTADVSLDPVGSCVGIRGSRVRAITDELNGEKIDIIHWNNNLAQLVINSMMPAEISKIVFDENAHRIQVLVPDDQLSLAIGRQGQNVRLASSLIGWKIDIMSEADASQHSSEEFAKQTNLLVEHLKLDEIIAQLLVSQGYTTIEQIAYTEDDELLKISELTAELVAKIKTAAVEYVEHMNVEIIDNLEQLGVEQSLLDLIDLPPEYILKLATFGVKTIEDLAEVTKEEFRSIVNKHMMNDQTVEELIDFAQKHVQETLPEQEILNDSVVNEKK